MWMTGGPFAKQKFPQGLKPDAFCGICGTTKVVPFHQALQLASFSAAYEVVP
jgi:hypothetical protein